MKKWAVFAVCLFSLCANGQDFHNEIDVSKLYPKRFISQIELFLGPNIEYGWFESTPSMERLAMMGISSHLGLVHQFNSRFAINLMVGYQNKGAKWAVRSFDVGSTPPDFLKQIQTVRLNYAAISLLPRFLISKRLQFYIGVGPYFGYLVSQKYNTELYRNGLLIGKSGSRPGAPEFNKKTDGGLTSIIGYNIGANSKRAYFIQFNYDLGLINVNRPITLAARNVTFSLLFGISLNKKNFPNR